MISNYFLSWPWSDFSPRIVSISSCMKAQGTVDPCRGHLSPLGQKACNRNCQNTTEAMCCVHLAALLDDGVPAAGEAELVSDVTGTLYEVSVLKLPAAVCTLEERRPHLSTAVTGARHLVRSGPGGWWSSLK